MSCTFTNAVVTTRNLSQSQKYFTEGLKLIPVEEFTPDPEPIKELWGLDRSYKIKSLLLKRRLNDKCGFLRLMEISEANGTEIRKNSYNWDHGILTIEFGVINNKDTVTHLGKLGYPTLAGPQRYDFTYFDDPSKADEGYYVIDSIVEGPEKIKTDFLERHNAPFMYGVIDEASGFTEMIGSAIVVESMDEGINFYNGTLGIPVRGNFKSPGGPHFAEMLKIPPDIGFDWSFIVDISKEGCFIELLSFPEIKGRQVKEQSSPLNYGISVLSFSCNDLENTYKKVNHSGFKVVSSPREISIEGIGKTTAFACYAPSEILCEIYQTI